MTMDEAGFLQARTLLFGNGPDMLDYRVRALLLEFENVGAPATPASIPTFDETDTIDYYLALNGSSIRDYVRIPFATSSVSLDVDPNYASLAEDRPNRVTIRAATAAVVGHNGLPFTNGANSKIVGAALVATPYPDDATRDIVFARMYYTVGQQTIRPATGLAEAKFIFTFQTG